MASITKTNSVLSAAKACYGPSFNNALQTKKFCNALPPAQSAQLNFGVQNMVDSAKATVAFFDQCRKNHERIDQSANTCKRMIRRYHAFSQSVEDCDNLTPVFSCLRKDLKREIDKTKQMVYQAHVQVNKYVQEKKPLFNLQYLQYDFQKLQNLIKNLEDQWAMIEISMEDVDPSAPNPVLMTVVERFLSYEEVRLEAIDKGLTPSILDKLKKQEEELFVLIDKESVNPDNNEIREELRVICEAVELNGKEMALSRFRLQVEHLDSRLDALSEPAKLLLKQTKEAIENTLKYPHNFLAEKDFIAFETKLLSWKKRVSEEVREIVEVEYEQLTQMEEFSSLDREVFDDLKPDLQAYDKDFQEIMDSFYQSIFNHLTDGLVDFVNLHINELRNALDKSKNMDHAELSKKCIAVQKQIGSIVDQQWSAIFSNPRFSTLPFEQVQPKKQKILKLLLEYQAMRPAKPSSQSNDHLMPQFVASIEGFDGGVKSFVPLAMTHQSSNVMNNNNAASNTPMDIS